jgi:anion-transporting  ArsA/GET3 family ATPase
VQTGLDGSDYGTRMDLLARRLVVVLGKGGVGRTTVAAALGLAASRRGRRALVVEVAGQHRLPRLFGAGSPPDGAETPLLPGLTSLSIRPQQVLEEYLVLTLKVRAVAERLADSRAIGYLTAAAPGLRELVTLGKIWHLTEQTLRDGSPRYDVVVVDAPATGHGVGFLRTPRQYAEIARAGRIGDEARAVDTLVTDRRRTGIVLVTLAEEMPVSETIDSLDRLREVGLDADCAIVNGLAADRFSAADEEAMDGLTSLGHTAAAAVAAARSQITRRGEQETELARLRDGLDIPLVELPLLAGPVLDREAVAVLAERLAAGLEAAG